MAGQSDRRYEELSASGEGASGYKYLPLPLTRTPNFPSYKTYGQRVCWKGGPK